MGSDNKMLGEEEVESLLYESQGDELRRQIYRAFEQGKELVPVIYRQTDTGGPIKISERDRIRWIGKHTYRTIRARRDGVHAFVSDLIGELQRLMKERGDVPVVFCDTEGARVLGIGVGDEHPWVSTPHIAMRAYDIDGTPL